MSLLHKALKKVERDTEERGEKATFVETAETGGKSAVLVKLLGIVAVGCLVLAVSIRFFKKIQFGSSDKEFSTPLQIAGGPGVRDLSVNALSLIQTGRYDEARQQLEKVVLLAPRDAEAYNNLGYTLKKLGQNDKALEQYQKALSIQPDCVECLNNLGVFYLSTRELEEAEAQFQKAIRVKPEYADPYFHLALLLESRGDGVEAKENYQKYVDRAQGVEADFLLKIQQRMADIQKP